MPELPDQTVTEPAWEPIKKKGRPKGASNKPVVQLSVPTPRRPVSLTSFSPKSLASSSTKPTVSPSASIGFPKFKVGGTSGRSKIYLLEQLPTSTLGAELVILCL